MARRHKSMRRRALVAAGTAGALTAGAAALYVAQRKVARGWRVDADTLLASGRTLPADLEHHFVQTSDGGRIHVVERGEGPPIVLVHGITLGVATWAPQLRALSERHRVIALGQRGHGQSVAGDEGFALERLGTDLLEVFGALGVAGAVLVGHSMGGMVAQVLLEHHPEVMGAEVAGLVLLGTASGPLVPGSASALVSDELVRALSRTLDSAESRGRGLVPQDDLASWATRACFGSRPDPADLELTRSMISAMSPAAVAGLLPPLLGFDERHALGQIAVPTRVVVGSRDLLTPVWMSRFMAERIPGATLTVLGGCGHMAMLERPAELNALLEEFAASVASASGS